MEQNRPSLLKPAIDPMLEMTDSDVFWHDHWRKFVWAIVAVVVLILATGAWMFRASHARSSAEALYSDASGPEGWDAVVARYPGSLSAGNARLRLASSLRSAGKFDEAAAVLEKLVIEQPDYPLAGAAWLTLGEIRQVQGKNESALDAYRTASAGRSGSYAAPLALLAEASLLMGDGKEGQAKAVLESIGTLYPETPAAMMASGELARMAGPTASPGGQ